MVELPSIAAQNRGVLPFCRMGSNDKGEKHVNRKQWHVQHCLATPYAQPHPPHPVFCIGVYPCISEKQCDDRGMTMDSSHMQRRFAILRRLGLAVAHVLARG